MRCSPVSCGIAQTPGCSSAFCGSSLRSAWGRMGPRRRPGHGSVAEPLAEPSWRGSSARGQCRIHARRLCRPRPQCVLAKGRSGDAGGIGLSPETIGMLTAYKGWRLLMMLGALPAVLTFFFHLRAGVAQVGRRKGQGSTSHWATVDLLGVVADAWGRASSSISGRMRLAVRLRRRRACVLTGGTARSAWLIAIVGYTFPCLSLS